VPENGHFLFVTDRLTMHHCRQIGHLALDTQAHADNAIYAGVDADGPAHILHTGVESGGFGRAKSRTGLPT